MKSRRRKDDNGDDGVIIDGVRLTYLEAQILELLSRGRTNKQIAVDLNLAVGKIDHILRDDNDRRSLYRKLGMGRAQAILWYGDHQHQIQTQLLKKGTLPSIISSDLNLSFPASIEPNRTVPETTDTVPEASTPQMQSVSVAQARKLTRAVLIVTLTIVAFGGIVFAYRRAQTSDTLVNGAASLRLDTWKRENDGLVGPLNTNMVLQEGTRYTVTISGTWNAWPTSWWSARCRGKPEMQPQVASPDVRNGPVGIDAAFIFAAPQQASICQLIDHVPVRAALWFPFEVSLDNGVNWNPLVPVDLAYNPDHKYLCELVGQGFPAQFRLHDQPTTDDNYGVLTILIAEASVETRP